MYDNLLIPIETPILSASMEGEFSDMEYKREIYAKTTWDLLCEERRRRENIVCASSIS